MKKQSYHHRKVRYYETPKLNSSQLVARLITSLDRLGHQKFSTEPGGYSLENWARGVNLLLDEFEQKTGSASLPPEYFEKRHELLGLLHRPVDLSSIDRESSELKQKEAEVERKLGETRTRTSAKIEELEGELARCSAELDGEKKRLSSSSAEERPAPFFRRLFGGNPTPTTEAPEDGVERLESKLSALSSELLSHRRYLISVNQRSGEAPFADEWSTLESLEARLKELESERLDRTQFVRERETITSSIASSILSAFPNDAKKEVPVLPTEETTKDAHGDAPSRDDALDISQS